MMTYILTTMATILGALLRAYLQPELKPFAISGIVAHGGVDADEAGNPILDISLSI